MSLSLERDAWRYGAYAGSGSFGTSQANAVNQPRELRLSERLSGIESGLSELVGKLNEVHQRMSACPEEGASKQADCVPGMMHSVTRIEHVLRHASSLANDLINAL